MEQSVKLPKVQTDAELLQLEDAGGVESFLLVATSVTPSNCLPRCSRELGVRG